MSNFGRIVLQCRDVVLGRATPEDIHASCAVNTFIESDNPVQCRDPRPTDPSYCDTGTNNFIDSDTSCKPVDTTDVNILCAANQFIGALTDGSTCREPRPTDPSYCDTGTNNFIDSDTSCKPVDTTDVNILCAANQFIGALTDGSTCREPRPTDPSYCDTGTNNFIDSDTSCKPVDTTDVHISCDVPSAITTSTTGPCVKCVLLSSGVYHCIEISEVQINTQEFGGQRNPSAAGLTTGHVVAWESFKQVIVHFWGIKAQPYNEDYGKDGSERTVSSFSVLAQKNPASAAQLCGGYVIAWQKFFLDTISYGIKAQPYNEDHTTNGPQFLVNSGTSRDQTNPAIDGVSDNGYVVAWQSSIKKFIPPFFFSFSWGIFAQAYNEDHSPDGPEFKVSSFSSSEEEDPAVAAQRCGGYVIAWQKYHHASGTYTIKAQPYNEDHTTNGPKFLVSSVSSLPQENPAADGLLNCGYIIVWQKYFDSTSSYGIMARVYNKDHSSAIGPFLVNTHWTGNQKNPTVIGLPNGGYMIEWQSFNQETSGSGYGIFARVYNKDHVPAGPEFQVNDHTPNNQAKPSLGISFDGHVVHAWESIGQDSSSYSIHGKFHHHHHHELV